MKMTKKSETGTKITFTYDKPQGAVEGYRYYADGTAVSRTFNPNDLEVTFGKVASGKYSVEALGFDFIARAEYPEAPPPTGDKLTWSPPSLSNQKTVTLTNQVGLTIDGGGGDVFVNPGFHRQVAFGNDHQIMFQNIRNLIVRSTRQTIPVPSSDDQSQRHGMQFRNITGHVFVEGFLWDGAPLRSFIVGENVNGATFTFQNCRVVGTRDNRHHFGGDFQHSDVMMHWGEHTTFQVDKCTFEYDNTGLAYYDGSSSPTQGPDRSDLRRLNLRCIHDGANGAFIWVATANVRSTAVDCWATTGKWNGIQKPLQDQIGSLNDYTSPPGSPPPFPWRYTPYKVTRPSNGATLVCNTYAEHSANGTLSPMGKQQGDYIERLTPQFAGERWHYGNPPGGDFCPDGLAGTNYISPGYV
jgi:hypothetical protein